VTTVDDALRALRLRRWWMLAGMVAGGVLAVMNAIPLFAQGARDWLDVGLVVIWSFVALSGAGGFWMLSRQIARLERNRPGL
jgi:hypothetical protein